MLTCSCCLCALLLCGCVGFAAVQQVLVHIEEQSPDIGQGVHGMGTKTLEETGEPGVWGCSCGGVLGVPVAKRPVVVAWSMVLHAALMC